jgi:hypothetical protein
MRFLTELESKHKKTTQPRTNSFFLLTSFFTLFFAKIILEDEINDFFSPRSPSTYYRLLLLNIVIIVECVFQIYVSDQSCQLSYLFALYKMIVTNTELFCSCVRLITLDGGN